MPLLLLLASFVSAAEPDPVLDGIVTEVERARGLELPDGTPPHHILVHAKDGWELRARARFGQTDWTTVRPLDDLKIEVRAGSPAFESSGLDVDRGQSGFGTSGLPDVPTERLVRERLWNDLDEHYKASVEALGRKMGAKDTLRGTDTPQADWQVLAEPLVAVERVPVREPSVEPMAALARTVSGALRDGRFDLVEVEVSERVGHRIIVGSDGTRVVTPYRWVWVGLEVAIRASDDEENTFRDFVVVTRREELPSAKELTERLVRLGERARTWADAPRLDAPWYGPVVVEGQAAAELISRVVLREVQGTPPLARWQSWNQQVRSGGSSGAQPGTRLLPKGWSVVDDPTAGGQGRCCWTIDAEGVPAQRVELLQDGLVVGHLMSRTPSEYFQQSTGHAREDDSDAREVARATFATVKPPSSVSRARLYAFASKEARRQGVDRVLVLRQDGSDLGWWRFADGREEPVRGFRSFEMDNRALRSVTVAGPAHTVDVRNGTVRLRVPDLLLDNVAVQPVPPSPGPPRRRSSPLAVR